MNAPDSASSAPTSQTSSKLIAARFSDPESLFQRAEAPKVVKAPTSIPLVRFQQLEQEIRNAPAVAGPYEELAQIYLQSDRYADARRVLESAMKNCPEHEPIVRMHEDLLLTLATHLMDRAKKERAEKPSEQSRFDYDQAEINLLNERIRVCKERYVRHPEQREILITWGIALRQSRRFEEAIERLQEACSDLELRSRASLQIGMCNQSLNRPLDALSSFRKASLFRSPPIDPKVAATALELAAKLAEDIGLVDSAIYYLQELKKVTPEDSARIDEQVSALIPKLPPQPETT